jgi:hypothetical protein
MVAPSKGARRHEKNDTTQRATIDARRAEDLGRKELNL